jgi:senataxin
LSERRTPIPTDGQKAIKPKILVCAPSNAAIDEVCKRLLNGVPSSKGNLLHPTIVRIGIEKSVNISVKEVSLDSLVEAAVSASSSHGVGNDYTRIQAQQAELKDKISAKQNQIQVVHDFDDRKKTLENELHALMSEKVALVKESSRARDAVKDASRHLDGARRAARDSILQDADIICATLSGSGHESLAPHTFETVIIDEAAQAIEMSCLIPLKYGCQRCIMVGGEYSLPIVELYSCKILINYRLRQSVRTSSDSTTMSRFLSESQSGTRQTCTSLGTLLTYIWGELTM